MAITFKCRCGQKYTVPAEMGGKSGSCKICGSKFAVPLPAGASALITKPKPAPTSASASAVSWHYTLNNETQKPVSAENLRKLAKNGTLKRNDTVWKEGMAEWVVASTIQGLFVGPPPVKEEPLSLEGTEPEPVVTQQPVAQPQASNDEVVFWNSNRIFVSNFRVKARGHTCETHAVAGTSLTYTKTKNFGCLNAPVVLGLFMVGLMLPAGAGIGNLVGALFFPGGIFFVSAIVMAARFNKYYTLSLSRPGGDVVLLASYNFGLVSKINTAINDAISSNRYQ